MTAKRMRPADERLLTAVLSSVASKFGVTVDELRSPRRRRPLPQIRAEYCRRAWGLNKHTIAQIGLIINRDHSTVMFALGRTKKKPSWYRLKAAE